MTTNEKIAVQLERLGWQIEDAQKDLPELDQEEKSLLAFLYAMNGRQTKSRIRDAWESGNYSEIRGLKPGQDQTLQHLRNTHGPTWLWNLSWKTL